ncbi:MAG: hypothetical protein ABI343_11900 [Burkholderiaceae bacterium]
MKKSVVAPSPIVPGKYFVFIERLVREHYQALVLDTPSEQAAHDQALQLFQQGSVAYMNCTEVEPPTARVRPLREKNLSRRAGGDDALQGDDDLRTAQRFLGPDNETLEPLAQFPGTRPAPVTRAQARLLCRNFDARGHSNHSGQGATLWVILEHCASVDLAFNLRAMPGMGYYVELAKSTGDPQALRMSVETEIGTLTD